MKLISIIKLRIKKKKNRVLQCRAHGGEYLCRLVEVRFKIQYNVNSCYSRTSVKWKKKTKEEKLLYALSFNTFFFPIFFSHLFVFLNSLMVNNFLQNLFRNSISFISSKKTYFREGALLNFFLAHKMIQECMLFQITLTTSKLLQVLTTPSRSLPFPPPLPPSPSLNPLSHFNVRREHIQKLGKLTFMS